jgi:hypothetical protein
MKIGILIFAHTNPAQLRLLVDALKTDFAIYVHIDKKCSISPDLFQDEENVYVIKRYKVYWAGYGMIYATLDLFKLAYSHHCDYFVMISGADFPVKTNQQIISEIKANLTNNFMGYFPLPYSDPAWGRNGGLDRLQLYWENVKNPKAPTLFNRLCGFGRIIQRALKIKRKLYPLPFYGGSNWTNLSRESVAYILSFVDQHPDYPEWFRYVRFSEEIWIQTIVMNSPQAEKTINNDRRYIDWKTGPDAPRLLREIDYEKIIASDAFFARKFDSNIDNVILEKLIDYRMNND